MSFLAEIKNAIFKIVGLAPGKSVAVNLKTSGGTEDDAELYHVPGILSKPVDGVYGVVIDVAGNNIVVATHDYNLIKSLDKGETFLYCIDGNGNILSSAFVNKDGEFVINDGTRSAVAFDKLKEGFDELKSDFNNFINNTYNLHNHPTAPLGPVSVPSVVGTQTSADIDDSEVDKVLLP